MISCSGDDGAVEQSGSSAGLGACTGDPVAIGSQVWQKCNLNVDVGNSRCYNGDPSNCAIYGRLYDWATAMDLPSYCNSEYCADQINEPHRGICPSGFHVPSNDDWGELLDYGGGSSVAGRKLKARSGWYSCGPSGSGNSYLCEDTYAFSALPGGYGDSDGYFDGVGDGGYWWSASEDFGNRAYDRDMCYDIEYARWSHYDKSYLFSVRCLQD